MNIYVEVKIFKLLRKMSIYILIENYLQLCRMFRNEMEDEAGE